MPTYTLTIRELVKVEKKDTDSNNKDNKSNNTDNKSNNTDNKPVEPAATVLKSSYTLAFQEKKPIAGLGNTTLISLNIKKEMYMPAHIEAVLQIELGQTVNVTAMTQNGVNGSAINYKSMLGRFVDLSDGEKTIAKDYIIFDYMPEYKPSVNGTALYLKLNIYSPEKVLSYQKYNKCYVAKKLGADVFKGIAAKYSNEIKKTSIDNLQHIMTKDAVGKDTEFIQPYLVQYEETALDFLARSANRCGEFMYYEDGTWQLGFKASTAIKVKNFASLTFNNFTEKEEENYFTTNYLKDENEQEQVKAEQATRSYTGPKPEFLDVLVEGESSFKKTFWEKYDAKDPAFFFNLINGWLKKTNVYEIVTSLGVDLGINLVKTGIHFKDIENRWTENFITPYKDNKEQSATVNNKKVVSQFSNYNACDTFSKKFYTDIKNKETAADTQTIHINFGTYYEPLLLGDVIEVLGGNYIVVKVSASCKQDTTVGAAGQYTTYEIDAIPTIEGGYYPPRVKKEPRKPVTQTAYVTANEDPCSLGRVQIRYPWQPKSDSPSSPWIRVSQAFASKDAGISFLPQVGDEILVGYEFGEIERPFMLGALASKERKIKIGETKLGLLQNDTTSKDHVNKFCKNDFMIKSINGQYIKFVADNNGTNATKAWFPAIGAWLSYLPMKSDIITYTSDDCGTKFSGGITMGDSYGFFKVQMSTEKRNVTISSPLGDVKLDALTGITISAPNGNVKIEGKNIDIVAGNNLTLKSGENVKKMQKAYGSNTDAMQMLKSSATSAVVKEATSLIKLFDMKLIRTVIEGFAKPIGGTTLIKSQRFMRLEAGKGSTKLPHTAYTKGDKLQKKEIEKTLKEMKVQDTINSIEKLMEAMKTFTTRLAMDVDTAKTEYENSSRILMQSMYNAASIYGFDPKYDGKSTKTATQEEFQQKFLENCDYPNDIIAYAKKGDAKRKDSHKKIDKITFSKSYTRVDINKMIADLKLAAEKLFIVAHAAKDVDYVKELTAEASVVCADESYIKRVDDLDTYKEEIKDILMKFFDQIKTSKNSTNGYDANKKRKIMYDVLQELKKKEYITIKNDAGGWNYLTLQDKRNLVQLNDSVCEKAETWEKYLKCVKAYKKEKNAAMRLLNFVANTALDDLHSMSKDWQQNYIYSPEVDGGEILISDSSGNTRNIQGDTITSVPNSPLSKAIGVLKKIKDK